MKHIEAMTQKERSETCPFSNRFNQYDSMANDNQEIKITVARIEERVEGLVKKIDKFIDSSPTMFANKFTEKIVWVGTATLIGLVLDRIMK